MKKILGSLTVILIIGLLAACNNDEDTTNKKENRVTPVETEVAIKDDFTIEKSVYGRTSPTRTTPIILQTPGELDTLEVENGDQVKKDDLIATVKTPTGAQNIRASKDGEIAKLSALEGDMLSDEEPLAVIVDIEKLKIDSTVTSGIQALFKKDDNLKVIIDKNELEAKITSIGTLPDDTGLYPIEATMDNKDKDILPGMVVTIIVPEKKLKDVLIVPTEAVVEENDETFVYVINEDKAKKINVKIKDTQSDKTAIKGDIKAEDQVVVNGQLTLNDGDQVDVVGGE